MRRIARPLVLSLCLAALGGCLGRDLGQVSPCVKSSATITVSQGLDAVDVLFVIDDSLSMKEERDNLIANFPRFMAMLTTGDVDGDGQPDFPGARDLHVGVVSTDMGTFGQNDVCTPNGQDGRLVTQGATEMTGCSASYPAFLGYAPSLDDPAGASAEAERRQRDFACVASLGTQGCGFEQQLEAALKAVTPSTSPIRFVSGTGHADGANAGFLRPNAVLAIVLLTDEDDCSALDPEIFSRSTARYPIELSNLRCAQYASEAQGALQPVQRYVDGFLAAVGGDASRLVVSVIAGVPAALAPDGTAPDIEALLAHPDLQTRADPDHAGQVVPSCPQTGPWLAYPPRRLLQVARGLGDSATVSSICRADLLPALRAVSAKVGSQLRGACLPRPLETRGNDGVVDCVVRETVPGRCADAPGAPACTTREERPGCRLDAEGCCLGTTSAGEPGQTCTIPQRGAAAASGWYYDTSSPSCAQRIAFTSDHLPAGGALVQLECGQLVGSVEPSLACTDDDAP